MSSAVASRAPLALITGAAGGIGRTVARSLASRGWRLALGDLDGQALESLRRALPGEAADHWTRAFDLGDPGACAGAVADAAGALGGLDAVVHAGAVMLRQPLSEVSEASLQKMLLVNIGGSFQIARAAATLMAGRGGGSIVLFSSQGAFTGGYVGSTVYSMTKGAVGVLVKSLAREFAARGVRVNGVAPGAIDTPMIHDGVSAEALNAFVDMIPMGRLGAPEEVAHCCEFLIGPGSSYVTGQMLHVNGGQLMP